MDGHGEVASVSHGRRLLDHLVGLKLKALPPVVCERAKLALLDCIGCAIFGHQFEWAALATEQAIASGEGAVTLLGTGRGAPAVAAALANGTAIHSFELDDVILGSLSHAGAAVIPAALAAAQLHGASGERLLAGIATGYELDARLGAALGTAPIALGFHTTSVAGPLAAALTACIATGETRQVLDHALGIAASTASGLKAFQQGTGGMVKRLHGGLAASNGVLAWQLARRGFDGPTEAIDGRYGIMDVFGGDSGRKATLTDGLGEDWAVVRNWTKMFPCCALIHTTSEALETLRRDKSIVAEDVVEVRIGTSERCTIQNADMEVRTSMHAQYSIPFSAGVALTGDARDPSAFLPDRLHDPAVRAMMSKVRLHVDAEVDATYPDRFGAKVSVRMKDDKNHTLTK